MRISVRAPKSIDKHGPLSREGMDQIGKIFGLDHTVILKTRDGVISQLERPFFDSSKPASKREKSNGFCSRVSTRITGRGVLS